MTVKMPRWNGGRGCRHGLSCTGVCAGSESEQSVPGVLTANRSVSTPWPSTPGPAACSARDLKAHRVRDWAPPWYADRRVPSRSGTQQALAAITVWSEWAGEELNESEWLSFLDRAQRESAEEDALVRGEAPEPASPPVYGRSVVPPPPPRGRTRVPGLPPRPSANRTTDSGLGFARQLRRSEITQSDLAQELGLTRAAVSAWITGRAEPRSEVRLELVKALERLAPWDTEQATEVRRMLPADSQRFSPLKRWTTGAAVLIGVSEYTQLPPVPSIKNNLSALTEVALTGLGIPRGSVYTVENPTSAARVHEKIDLAMDAADPRSGGFFIYFAGHGWTDPRNGRLLLGLVDSNQDKVWTAMEFDRIRELEGTYVMTSSNATNASRAPRGDHFTTFTGEIIRTLTDGIPGGPPVIDTAALFHHVRASCQEQGWPEPSRQIGRDGDRVELVMNNKWGRP